MRHLDSQWRLCIGWCLFVFFETDEHLEPEKQLERGGEP